jgi:geranylgeranyl pyrophosphate synthase
MYFLDRSMNKLSHKLPLIEEELIMVEKYLRKIVESAGPEINEVGDYIFNGTGKRIRPALFLLAAYKADNCLAPLINAAVSFELMHTASLLHDDVIDQASTRRGKDAVHIKWNNKISVLSGDYLLSQAFKILVDYRNWSLMKIVTKIVQNMAEGEVEQAFATVKSPDLEERYFQWIGKKSAYFFAGCCQAGSLLGGGDEGEQLLWSEFGYNLGIAFQLIDDLLDYTGTKESTGKPLYGDLNNRVITLPLIRTLNSNHNSKDISKEAMIALLREGDASAREFEGLARMVVEGDGPAYTYDRAEEYVGRAVKILETMPMLNPSKKNLLDQLTRDVLIRKN